MSITGFLLLLLIAAICGGIGKSLSGYSFGGCFVSIVIGFIGAYIGTWIADKFDFPQFYTIWIEGREFPVVWAIIGSALFSLILGSITRGSKN